ncbi:MAG: hypothetical protein J3K34DRAFT_417282 [Monoraphidium minutum]|nr:MAG: hypothetical protein J3K34DRAFT_417282 [Monoraphidium minutum]
MHARPARVCAPVGRCAAAVQARAWGRARAPPWPTSSATPAAGRRLAGGRAPRFRLGGCRVTTRCGDVSLSCQASGTSAACSHSASCRTSLSNARMPGYPLACLLALQRAVGRRARARARFAPSPIFSFFLPAVRPRSQHVALAPHSFPAAGRAVLPCPLGGVRGPCPLPTQHAAAERLCRIARFVPIPAL